MFVDAGVAQEALTDQREVEHAPVGHVIAQAGELGQDLLPHLEAAPADARADRRGRRLHLADAPLDDARRQPAPATVDHRDAARPGERHGQAIRDVDERRQSLRRRSPSRQPDPGPPPAPRSHADSAFGSLPSARCRRRGPACRRRLPAGSTPSAPVMVRSVRVDRRRVVVGQQSEVERGKRALGSGLPAAS